jgi:hypothetical protein
MSKIYRYEKLTYTGGEEENIIFKVQMISNGNRAKTIIGTSAQQQDLLIEDTGEADLGILKGLTRVKTAVYSNVNNLVPISDDIIVEYYINNILLLRHENLKSESDDSFLILKIKFIKS